MEVPETLVGGFGVVAGVTELLGSEAKLVPLAFVAVMVKVYIEPFVNPVIVTGELELVMNGEPTIEFIVGVIVY